MRFGLALLAAALVEGQAQPPGAPAAGADGTERVVSVTARRFSYTPSLIELELGIPVVIELTSLDRDHGFNIPDLGVRADLLELLGRERARLRQNVFGHGELADVVQQRSGLHALDVVLVHPERARHVFCGSGHEEMAGRIVVVPPRQSRR